MEADTIKKWKGKIRDFYRQAIKACLSLKYAKISLDMSKISRWCKKHCDMFVYVIK